MKPVFTRYFFDALEMPISNLIGMEKLTIADAELLLLLKFKVVDGFF